MDLLRNLAAQNVWSRMTPEQTVFGVVRRSIDATLLYLELVTGSRGSIWARKLSYHEARPAKSEAGLARLGAAVATDCFLTFSTLRWIY